MTALRTDRERDLSVNHGTMHITQAIGSVHPSESGTIAAFRVEKGESQLDKKGNVINILISF